MKLSQPTWPRVLPTSVVLACARLGPLGRRLPAPGTWGSAAGLVYFLVFLHLHPLGYTLLCMAGLYFVVAFCGEAELGLGKKNPREVNLEKLGLMTVGFFASR